jgi:hypothetical protein
MQQQMLDGLLLALADPRTQCLVGPCDQPLVWFRDWLPNSIPCVTRYNLSGTWRRPAVHCRSF